ncbi:hypothetical protein C7212DRAFT_366247 [Tuber magnatum]|uniref:Rhodopsin domain-containing protein n=1 Tax=Tuber magnatum TaxID=42249 RepID=A0A317SHS1_9PEZI|nr:hypothetical protein C7212DRAFT_366247 [Tuber magnatum]
MSEHTQTQPGVQEVVISVSVMFPIVTLAVAFRVWVNKLVGAYARVSVRVSDGFVGIAWMFYTVGFACCLWRSEREMAYKHALFFPKALKELAGKMAVVETMMYYSSLWMVKAAFISMYFGVATNVSKRLRYLLYAMTVIVFVSYAVTILTSVFSCLPFSANWAIEEGAVVPRCQMINSHTFIHTTVLNAFTDLLVMGMPFLILRLYALQLRDIWGLSFLLVLGSISIIAATVRAANIVPIDQPTMDSLANTRKVEILSFGELVAVFFAACAPSIRALMHRNKKKEVTSRYLSGMDRSSITGSYELEGVISLELSTKQLPEMPEDETGLVNKAGEPIVESTRECDIGVAVSFDDG